MGWAALVALAFLPQNVWAAAGGEEHGFPGKALIFAGINFLIFILILGYFLHKPMKEFFSSRAAVIGKDIHESQNLKQEAEQKYAEYEQRMKSIEAEMQHLITELKKDGQLERDRLLATAEEQAEALKHTSERIMDQELRRAKEELKQEAVQLAAEMAEDLLKKNITAEDQQRIVKQYIHKVEHLS